MKKLLLIFAVMAMSLSASAQWTKPTPKGQAFPAEPDTVYLYNVDADGFLCGANDWGTRASVVPMHGHKIWLQKFEYEGLEWDGKSYFIWNAIEDGGMKGQNGVMFMSDAANFWVDRTVDSDDAKQFGGFVFADQGDNIYKIQPNSTTDFFIGMKPVNNDNRLYLNVAELEGGFAPEEFLTRWMFVSMVDYVAYQINTERYEVALGLGKALDKVKAESPSADVTEVQKVYDNTNSSLEQLREACTQLAQLAGSLESPVDVTVAFVVNPTYKYNNNNGWAGDVPGFQLYGNAERYNGTIDHYQNLSGLPNGVYRVVATGYYRSGSNTVDAQHFGEMQEGPHYGDLDFENFKLYVSNDWYSAETAFPLQNSGASTSEVEGSTSTASTTYGYVPNNMETAGVYMAAGQYEPTQALAFVNDGKLTIGVRKTQTISDDWAIWDDWQLLYAGSSDATYVGAAKEILLANEGLAELLENSTDTYYQHSVLDAYKAAEKKLAEATTAADIVPAITAYNAALRELMTSVAAYESFEKLYNEATAWLETKTSDSEEVALLADYLNGDTEDGYNGHGSADYILNNGTLNPEELKAEEVYLNRIWNDAMSNSMADGDDCTAMLKNPNFADATGWKYGDNVTLAPDNMQVMQGWNVVFDVYQELGGLQNGLYELSYNGLFRPTGSDASQEELVEKAKAFAYINNYDTRMPSILDDLSEESIASDDARYQGMGYGPNSAAGAATHFQAGKYAAHAYGIVTDGTMRIGFKNNLRTDDNCVAWVGPVKLIYRSKNAEALKEVIDATIVIVNEKLGNYCGNPELDAMSNAATHASTCADNELYQALIDLKKTIEDVDLGTEAYQRLWVALFNLDQAILGNEKASDDVIKTAKALFDEVDGAYRAQSYSTAEADEATTNVNAMVVKILFPDEEKASEENPVEYTSAIVNPNFDPSRGSKNDGTIEGWTTTPMNGYKEYTVSYNRAAFELNQKLTGLPKGKYKVMVHTYYRAGYYNEEEDRISRGEETHLTTLYARTSEDEFTTKVKNLSEDATAEAVDGVKCYTLSNGKFAPDGTTPSAAYFAAGYYQNELRFTVPEDGEVIIGLSKTETYANDYEVVGAWELWYMGEEQDGLGEEQDLSTLIVNNTFDPSRGSKNDGTIEGWTTTPMNGYKEYTVSYNRAAFDLYQDLAGLREGTYKVTVHTYYRAGYYNEEEERVSRGEETHLTTFYAQTSDETYSKPVMNLYEDATEEPVDGVKCYTLSNGKYAPDGTTPTAAYFAAGHYLNELPFYVGTDGKARIGLKKTEVLANDYEVVGEWNLYYYGSGNNVDLLNGGENGICTTPSADAFSVGIYSLGGTRLSAPQRGVNIIRMSDGTVRKVMIK